MSNDEYFVEIDGRKVPTSKQLRKMGLMIGGSIRSVKTKVTDIDYALTSEQVRTIVWSLMKYSSIAFLQHIVEILVIIERSYTKAISGFASVDDIDIENLKYLNEAVHIGEIAKDLILANNKALAYKHFGGINGICVFHQNFTGRKGSEYSWEWLGKKWEGPEKRHKGLYLWIDKAMDMTTTLQKGELWAWPSTLTDKWLNFPIPLSFRYIPETTKMILKTGDTIPATGIWNPCDFRSGCPSFLLAGDEFPNTEIAHEKMERPEYFSEDYRIHYKGWLDYEYQEFPSRWELLWEDTRYHDGTISDEEKEYLDESCAFPVEPPEVPGK